MAWLTESDYGKSDRAWLEIDWSKQIRRLHVGSTPVVYAELGEGPPLVLVHGLGGCWQNWLENIPHLSRRHRVIAVDLPGFGSSPPPPGPVDVNSLTHFVRAFCDQLDLGPDTTLVGHSMGGAIAADLAAISPGRFDKVVLVAAAGVSFARARHQPATLLGRIFNLVRPFTARYTRDAVLRPHLRRALFSGVIFRPQKMDREILFEIARGGGVNAPSFAEAFVSLMGHDGRAQLADIEMPTLVIWGMNDRIVPVTAALIHHQRIPDSRLEIFNHTGHMIMMERPQRFNAVLDDFLGD